MTCEGYVWDAEDQVGTYDDPCGGEESIVAVGENADAAANERWAVIDKDADWEGPGVVSTHSTREDAWAAAIVYCDLRALQLDCDALLTAFGGTGL